MEEQRGQRLAQMPFDVIGEHAKKDMGTNAIGGPMADRANLEIDGLQATESALDAGQILVGLDALRRAHRVGRQAGADDIEPLETGLSRDAVQGAAAREV